MAETAPATPVNRAERRRAETRRQLTTAAREIITERGVAGLRIAEITDTADVGRGSFYNHFGSKEELVEAVVTESLQELAVRVLDGIPEDEDPAVAACLADHRFIRMAYDDPAPARLVVNLNNGDTVFAAAVRPFARTVLERGLQSGRFRVPDADVALIILTGSAIALTRAILDGEAPENADVAHAESVLVLFGIPADEAHEITRRALR